ncbi:MAG: hypothetical protein QNJ75_08085 [Acidimicrobiia bacterium]|nr:hypothetical protein [Acidimicrobiia bacterium]
MRNLIVGAIGVAAAVVVVLALSSSGIDADTPVDVLIADEVVLHLPVSPSVERIVADLHLELVAVADSSSDSRVEAALRRIDDDNDLLRAIAASPVHMFDSGEAAATATAVYDIQLESDRVTLTVATVELVPAYGSTARSREHEDGHALINERVAERCAAEALQVGIASGLRGELLVNRMVAELSASGDPVHDVYHSYVHNADYGEHIRAAERALEDVPGC